MAERGIIMSGPMVRAILREIEQPGTGKTQTRRVLKPPQGARNCGHTVLRDYDKTAEGLLWWWNGEHDRVGYSQKLSHAVGDRLYVRETFVVESNYEYRDMWKRPDDGRPIRTVDNGPDWGEYELIPHYRATEPEPNIVPPDLAEEWDDRTRWRPSIHMPRWASRITLRVTDVRVQRVQEISVEDAIAEGVGPDMDKLMGQGIPGFCAFIDLWNSLHGPDAWERNDWVCAVSFSSTLKNIDEVLVDETSD